MALLKTSPLGPDGISKRVSELSRAFRTNRVPRFKAEPPERRVFDVALREIVRNVVLEAVDSKVAILGYF